MKEKYRHPEPSTAGLVANYKLWAGLTSTASVFDYTLNGFTGTPTGTDITPAYPGFRLNGTDDIIDVTAAGPAKVKTFLMWIKVDSVAGNNGVVDLNTVDTLALIGSTLTGGGFAGGTGVLYVDGESGTTVSTDWHLVGTTTTIARAANALIIGGTAILFLDGLIGESMLYDRVLSPAEVKSVYELTKWRYPNN